MKNLNTRIASSLVLAASLLAGVSTAVAQPQSLRQQPVAVTPPAVNNGSNFSRAPFIASRQFDDATTNPAGTVGAYKASVAQTVSTEPVLVPTGRPSAAINANASAYPAYRNTAHVTPPAVNNGSNFSRAPIPAVRQFDDTKGPDGQAVDSAR